MVIILRVREIIRMSMELGGRNNVMKTKELQIDFDSYDHPVVLTVEAQAKYVEQYGGALSKNLLLMDKKSRFYLVSALAGTNIDLKVLSQRLGLGKGGVRMAPEEALHELLQAPLGCVTPFALVNDSARNISLLLDQGFKAHERCFFHSLSNDMTISVSPSNLDIFLTSIGRMPSYVDLEANPGAGLGKDNPPDLAAFVPSEGSSLPQQINKPVFVVNHVPVENTNKKSTAATTHSKATLEKCQSTTIPMAGAINVSEFVREVIAKTSAVVLSEIDKAKDKRQEVDDSSIVDSVRKRVTSDLESLVVILKNQAYTEGFHSGFKSALPALPPSSTNYWWENV